MLPLPHIKEAEATPCIYEQIPLATFLEQQQQLVDEQPLATKIFLATIFLKNLFF